MHVCVVYIGMYVWYMYVCICVCVCVFGLYMYVCMYVWYMYEYVEYICVVRLEYEDSRCVLECSTCISRSK